MLSRIRVSPFRYLQMLCLSCAVGAFSAGAQTAKDHLANNTLLVIRHAEKPASGSALNDQGKRRAELYARYFEPFREDGLNLRVDALYAGADSESSYRPRLTLEPLSKATGLSVDTRIGTKEPEKLVQQLREEKHGTHPLIAWRHGQIPALLRSLGASPEKLLPDGTWPDSVYDWVIVLHFDEAGHLKQQQRLQETLKLEPGFTE